MKLSFHSIKCIHCLSRYVVHKMGHCTISPRTLCHLQTDCIMLTPWKQSKLPTYIWTAQPMQVQLISIFIILNTIFRAEIVWKPALLYIAAGHTLCPPKNSMNISLLATDCDKQPHNLAIRTTLAVVQRSGSQGHSTSEVIISNITSATILVVQYHSHL